MQARTVYALVCFCCLAAPLPAQTIPPLTLGQRVLVEHSCQIRRLSTGRERMDCRRVDGTVVSVDSTTIVLTDRRSHRPVTVERWSVSRVQVMGVPRVGPRPVCFRGQPRSRCISYPVTEVGYARSIVGRKPAGLATVELGWMHNVAPNWGMGGTLLLLNDSDWGSRTGVKVRARRWLKPPFSVELGAGVYLSGDPNAAPGFTGHVALNIADLVAITTQLEALPGTAQYPGSVWPWLGVRAGSQPGAAVIAALVAFVVAFALATGPNY